MKSVSLACLLLTGLLPSIGKSQQVRVSVQYVELPHADLTSLLADSPGNAALHAEAMEMVRGKKARIVETCIGVCQSGGKATIESFREEIYPTEVTPPELPCSIGNSPPVTGLTLPEVNYSPKHRSYTAFETRNIGTMLEMDAHVSEGERLVDLRLVPEFVNRMRLETMTEYKDERGDASIRMPIYETWRANTQLTLRAGQFSLVSVFSPKRRVPAPFVDSRVLLFARVDVLPEP